MFLTAAVALASCNGPEKTCVDVANIKPAEINSYPTENVVLDRTQPDISQVTVKWSRAQYGYSAAVTYTLIASVTDQAGAIKEAELGQSNVDSLAITNKALAGALVGTLGATAGVPFEFDVKLICEIGAAKYDTVSLPVKMSVTPYSLDPIPFWVIGNYCEWNHDNATQIYSATANGIYTGWVPMFDGEGSTTPFKFSEAPNWDGKNYGGSLDALSTSGGNIEIEGGNVKLFTLDIPRLTAKVEKTFKRLGLIGDATPNEWGTPDTEMIYDAATKTYTTRGVVMKAGAFKFRADNDWGTSWGTTEKVGVLALAGGGENITFDKEPGTYTVIVRFFNSTITYEFIAE